MLSSANRAIRDQLKRLLESNIVTVKFVKKDGEVREMVCTLDPDRIPVTGYKPGSEGFLQEEERSKRWRNEDVLAVWDMEKQDWRSFRIDSIITYIARRAEASWTSGNKNVAVREHLQNRLRSSWLPEPYKEIFSAWLDAELRGW